MDHNQFEQLQTGKTISAYGGVGSILETRFGSIMIEPFNTWPYFRVLNGRFTDEQLVIDKRFKNRLKKYFSKLEYLVRVPVNDISRGNLTGSPTALIGARYFPEWFYCNYCKKFDRLSNWHTNWTTHVMVDDREKFHPPKCYHCYVNQQKAGKRKVFYNLEQIRFVMTAPNGEIKDIPWDRWALLRSIRKKQKEMENTDDEEEKMTLGTVDIPEGLRLELKTSDKLNDLNGIWVIAFNKSGEQIAFSTLTGLFNLRIQKKDIVPNNNEEISFKPVIRTSNSVYYPNILYSIYLPAEDELNDYAIKLIQNLSENGLSADKIASVIAITNELNIDASVINHLINNGFDRPHAEIAKTENEYRFDEYHFITTRLKENIEDKLIFEKIPPDCYPDQFIKSIYRLDKLKITSIQTSYTRQEPIDKDYYLRQDEEIRNTREEIKKKYTSEGEWQTSGLNTRYLPAIESFGEGIFLDFPAEQIDQWIKDHPKVIERVTKIQESHQQSESPLNKELQVTAKLILLHTFSHIIIKELEFLCGYPATSLKERLYVDEDRMQGLLIYTIAGSEGSYGGITSICYSDKIGKIIQSALIRAQDCASDPICYHSSGQGVNNLNLSACYSCSLLPEISCEQFNCYLDRRLLIDHDFGYFKDLLF